MPFVRFDPAAMRLWRQAEALAARVDRVHVLLARSSPAWSRRGVRWDEQGAHQHAVPTLVACLAGVVRVATAHGAIDLAAHEACAVAPAAWHAHAALRPGSVAYAQGFLFGRSDVVLHGEGRSFTALTAEEPARALLRRILASEDAGERCLLLRQIATSFLDTAAEVRQPHPAVTRMGYRMWGSLDRDLGAAEVLAASGLGARQAHRLFCAWFGMPPARAIVEQRLALAEELLAEGMPVGAAARACGYTDRRVFTRAWRRRHGASPSQRSGGGRTAP